MTTGPRDLRLSARRTDAERVVPVRHPLRWAFIVVVALFLVMLAHGLVTNRQFKWPLVAAYLFNEEVVAGVARTVGLTAAAMAMGLVLGTALALMRLSESRFLSGLSWSYVWFFRATPVLVQIIFWYNFGALYAMFSLGVPFGPELLTFKINNVITPLAAALLGLGLNQAAYTAEIIRGGIISVDRGQTEAALALGMSGALVYRRIVLPQAMRVIIPPVGNEVISMVKNSTLVSVIALAELLYSVQLIYSRTYQTIPLLVVACVWYLAIVSVLSVGQHFLERRYGRR
ncbi:MAG TPA: amino acid ABC transporter permease [Streptosporangiaceae bacterium]|jgi:polar amino acid transport system permease protein